MGAENMTVKADGRDADLFPLTPEASMFCINQTIRGVPYSKQKARGNQEAPAKWSAEVVRQTGELPKIKDACLMKVTFLLPPDKYPRDMPYGPDLDNLLKRLLDALNQTIFSGAKGGDSCIVSLTVMKTKVSSYEESGVHIEVMPVKV
jgi:Holliday junction resolvase RusA-like endonuclease